MSRIPMVPGDRYVPWLGKCAEHWVFKPIKYCCSLNSRVLPEKTDAKNVFRYIDISSVESNGNWQASEPMSFDKAPSRARRVIQDGDILISTVRTYLLAITYIPKVNDNLICSTGFAVLSPHREIDSEFLSYWVRSNYFVDEIMARSVGVSYPAINTSDIGNLPVPCLDLNSQKHISDFLYRETTRIDSLIEKKQRQIELLKEKRAALISYAVTKGLDPEAKMKDSGIKWLGEIPENWKRVALKRICALVGRIGFRGYSTNDIVDEKEGAITLSPSNMKNDNLLLQECTYISWEKYYESPEIMVRPHDILIVKTGSSFGKVTYVKGKDIDYPTTINPQIMILKKIVIDPKFLFYVLASAPYQDYFKIMNTGSTIPTMTQEAVGSVIVPAPPLITQQKIVDFLDSETIHIDNIINKIEISIELLNEYQIALISAAVTGKIDVREEVS